MIRSVTICALALCLLACSTNKAPVHEVSSASVAEHQLVDNLNARYQNTVAQCNGGTPAYYCSGIILRTSTFSPSFDFWTHSDPAGRLGSLTFSYIRRDIDSNGSDLGSGFIFSDQETALAENKAPTVRCIYPFQAGTQDSGRPGFGCGFASTTTANQETDLSTCATLATPAITAQLWKENFVRFGSNARNQCSLSTQVASQFQASLEAHNLVTALATTRNELLIATWREEAPGQLPIEAFFYNGSTGGLLNAQALRHAWFVKTSQRLPIVRMNFSAADRNIFTTNEADQVDGWDVANQLNARYNDTADNCNGQAAFYCNGVFIRMTTYGSDFHSWNPNPNTQTAVSFSYLRRDLKMTHGVFMGSIEQGFAFTDASHFGQQGVYPLSVLCSFPYDAQTYMRLEKGCGASGSYPANSGICNDQGITTLAAWRAHFNAVPVSEPRYQHQCGFRVDPDSFAVSLIARENPDVELSTARHNEILIDRWPQNIPAQLPIEAFVYVYDETRALGLAGAQFIQRDFYRQTGQSIPVVRIAFRTGGDNIFSYAPADQGL